MSFFDWKIKHVLILLSSPAHRQTCKQTLGFVNKALMCLILRLTNINNTVTTWKILLFIDNQHIGFFLHLFHAFTLLLPHPVTYFKINSSRLCHLWWENFLVAVCQQRPFKFQSLLNVCVMVLTEFQFEISIIFSRTTK